MKYFLIVFLLLCASQVYCQDQIAKKWIGMYVYGNSDPIYLENDDGTVDSSFSYCSLGEMEIYYINDSLLFQIRVCNATYHIGQVNGYLELITENEAEFIYDEPEEDIMDCHLTFALEQKNITVEEKACRAYHGARAGFDGVYEKVSSENYAGIDDRDFLKKATEVFFEAFNKGDLSALNSVIIDQDMILTDVRNVRDSLVTIEVKWSEFAPVIVKGKGTFEEKIENVIALVDGNYGITWMDYTLYLKNEISHCGINKIEWLRTADGWKIQSMTDTHRKYNCKDLTLEPEDRIKSFSKNIMENEVHQTLNNWHKAAANTNSDLFFGLMSDDAYYLGTDPGERWTKEEFKTFAMPYFEKGKAWDFKPNWRYVYFTNDLNYAWFEESLDTWMGESRGSGILRRENGQWKIVQYNLALTIFNERMKHVMDVNKK